MILNNNSLGGRLARLIAAMALVLATVALPASALALAACSPLVTTTADSGGGSLREAVGCATAGQTVTFSGALAGSTISLTSGEIAVTQPITIDGSAAPGVTVDANNLSRVFNITANGPVTLVALVLQHGSTSGAGGAIQSGNNAPLTLQAVAVLNSTSTNGSGGGIYAGSALTLIGSRLQGNRCLVACYGGGTWANTTLVMTDSELISNTASSAGAALVNGPVVLNGGMFQGNHTNGSGAVGALLANNSVTLMGTAFIGNYSGSDGGAMKVIGSLTLYGGRFVGNYCTGVFCSGGAVWVNQSLVVSGTVFVANSSQLAGGALLAVADATLSGARFDGNACYQSGCMGGAVYGPWITALNSSWRGNTAAGLGAGIYVTQQVALNLANVTLSGNIAQGAGGGLYAGGSGRADLVNVTLADNQAPSGSGLSAETGVQVGITNTLFANNSPVNCAGQIDQGGNNLEWPGSTCATAGPSAGFSTADPLLGTPAHNPPLGGFTYPLLAGSPARDAGDDAACAGPLVNNRDQRGQARPYDGDAVPGAVCDIGAFEAAGPLFDVFAPVVLR